jgi:glycosyltransferase involved in cell wall biosynthesis
MSFPFVSVVIPTHNRPEMLAEALASVRAQTFTDYEIIVVSNGESAEIRHASHEVAAAHDCRYFTLRDGNVSAARNFGIAQARGDWIAFLDDDDLWLPTKLERQVAEANRTGDDLIACDYVKFFPDGSEIVEQPRFVEGWSCVKAINHGHWWTAPSATMVRKRIFDEIGGFDPHLRVGEDNDMWRRISWRHTLHQMDETLVRYRSGHPRVMQRERMRYLYDLRHYMKMCRDTPHDLRWALPPASSYVPPRLLGILGLNEAWQWLRWGPHPWLRPRKRWIQFRRWLNRAREAR